MSRSRRKHPIIGITTAESEKKDKQRYNRRYRHRTRQWLRSLIDPADHEPLPLLSEFSNPWCMDKDGKRYFDSKQSPRLMRK